MSNVIAYCRVSTLDQDTALQEIAIKKQYPNAIIRHEKKSGTTRDNRPVLELILDLLHSNDKLVVWKLDRLARNMRDLLAIVELVESKNASLEILDQRIDTSTASGKAFLQMLGVFAEFETNIRKERQKAGLEKARKSASYKGRKPTDSEIIAKIKNLADQEIQKTKIAERLGISRATVYRALNGTLKNN